MSIKSKDMATGLAKIDAQYWAKKKQIERDYTADLRRVEKTRAKAIDELKRGQGK